MSSNTTPSVTEADLATFDDEFEQAEVDDREIEDVPDGKYQVRVDRVELSRTQNDGHPMLKWTLRILGPKYANRLLWRNSVLASKENVRWLKSELHMCGVVIEKLSDLPANLERLLDVKLEVTKKTKGDSENVYLNRRIVLDDTSTEGHGDAGNADADIPF